MFSCFTFHLSPRLCPSTARCSPPSMSSVVFLFHLSPFTKALSIPLHDVAFHQCLLLFSCFTFHLSPRLCPSTARCSLPSMSSVVFLFHLSPFTKALSIHLHDVAFHQCLLLFSCFTFHLSPRLCPSTARCSLPSMSSVVFLFQPFTFHQGFVHPLHDVAFHQCLLLFSCFTFHLSPRLCPSTARCSPPSMPSIVFCFLVSHFTFHQGFVHPLQDVAFHQCLLLSSSTAVLFQVVPSFLVMSSCHLLLGRPLDLFPLLGCHSVQCLVHILSFILAICPAHLHFCFSVYSIMSICQQPNQIYLKQRFCLTGVDHETDYPNACAKFPFVFRNGIKKILSDAHNYIY